MLKEISNFQMEEVFSNLKDEDINNNFAGVFHFDKISKFIDFKRVITEKKS